MRKRSLEVTFLAAILVLPLVTGCARSKKLEETNREQGRVIADLNQQVAGLQEELARAKEGCANKPKAQSAAVGGQQKQPWEK